MIMQKLKLILNTNDIEKILKTMRLYKYKFKEADMFEDFEISNIKKPHAFSNEFNMWIKNFLNKKNIHQTIISQFSDIDLRGIPEEILDMPTTIRDNMHDIQNNSINLDISEQIIELRKPQRDKHFFRKFQNFTEDKLLKNQADFLEEEPKFGLENIENFKFGNQSNSIDQDLKFYSRENQNNLKSQMLLGYRESSLFDKQEGQSLDFKQFTYRSFQTNTDKSETYKTPGKITVESAINYELNKLDKVIDRKSLFNDLQSYDYNVKMNRTHSIPGNTVAQSALKFDLETKTFDNLFNPFSQEIKDVSRMVDNVDNVQGIKANFNMAQDLVDQMKIEPDNYSAKYFPVCNGKLEISTSILLINGERDEVKSNWIYVYKLPYDFNKKKIGLNLKKYFAKYGEIQDMFLFRNSDFNKSSVVNQKKVFIDPNGDKFLLHSDPRDQNRPSTKEDSQSENSVDGKKARNKSEKSKPRNIPNQEQQELLNILNRNEDTLKFEKNNLYVRNMEMKNIKKKLRRLRKSYAMIKFKTKEAKEEAMNSALRIFGISPNLFTQFSVDDADYKCTLNLMNIPLYTSVFQLVNFINFHLEKKGFTKIILEDNMRNLVTSSQMIFLSFRNFEETIMICFLLNQLEFDGKFLACGFLDGPLKFKDGKLSENLEFLNIHSAQMKIEQNNIMIRREVDHSPFDDYLTKGKEIGYTMQELGISRIESRRIDKNQREAADLQCTLDQVRGNDLRGGDPVHEIIKMI